MARANGLDSRAPPATLKTTLHHTEAMSRIEPICGVAGVRSCGQPGMPSRTPTCAGRAGICGICRTLWHTIVRWTIQQGDVTPQSEQQYFPAKRQICGMLTTSQVERLADPGASVLLALFSEASFKAEVTVSRRARILTAISSLIQSPCTSASRASLSAWTRAYCDVFISCVSADSYRCLIARSEFECYGTRRRCSDQWIGLRRTKAAKKSYTSQ